jgi:acyl-CoA reductase-like NAD-dependent aldehyde dehydrogenase
MHLWADGAALRFKTDDEAIQMANDTEFGLACHFNSRDIGLIWRIAKRIEYGIVGINEGIISPNPLARSPRSEVKYLCKGGIDR